MIAEHPDSSYKLSHKTHEKSFAKALDTLIVGGIITQQLSNSATQQLSNSATQQLSNSRRKVCLRPYTRAAFFFTNIFLFSH